ncbi:MAG: hypothetical protein HZA63_02235 [Rhodocyclales bacterium]|nr:hypothetical protein [Rhodocyclales bacterium]
MISRRSLQGVQVRAAVIDDIPAIVARWRASGPRTESGGALDEVKLGNHLRRAVEDRGGVVVVLVAELAGEIRGLLAAQIESPYFSNARVARVLLWWVLPGYRHGPAGIKLWLAFRRWAAARQADEIVVAVTSGEGIQRTDRLLRKLGAGLTGGNYRLPLAPTAAS